MSSVLSRASKVSRISFEFADAPAELAVDWDGTESAAPAELSAAEIEVCRVLCERSKNDQTLLAVFLIAEVGSFDILSLSPFGLYQAYTVARVHKLDGDPSTSKVSYAIRRVGFRLTAVCHVCLL